MRAATAQEQNSGFYKVGTRKQNNRRSDWLRSGYFLLELKQKGLSYYPDSGALESPVLRKN